MQSVILFDAIDKERERKENLWWGLNKWESDEGGGR